MNNRQGLAQQGLAQASIALAQLSERVEQFPSMNDDDRSNMFIQLRAVLTLLAKIVREEEPTTVGQPTMTTWSIWVEGYAATGERGGHWLAGTESAPDFNTAVDQLVAHDAKFAENWDPKQRTWWGCRVFADRGDAARSFG
jgi:hypothetical protein